MSKLNIYKQAEQLCNQIQEKINSDDWIVLFQNELLMKSENFTPKFVFDSENLGIKFQESECIFVEIIAENDFEDTYKNVKEMRLALANDFSFIKKSNVKNIFGRTK